MLTKPQVWILMSSDFQTSKRIENEETGPIVIRKLLLTCSFKAIKITNQM